MSEDRLHYSKMSWHIINALQTFNSNPEAIEEIVKKLGQLKDHTIYGHLMFYKKAMEFYEAHSHFPSVKWLGEALTANIKVFPDEKFESCFYEDMLYGLDEEILKENAKKLLVENEDLVISVEDKAKLVQQLQDSMARNVKEVGFKEEDLMNLFDDHCEGYKGIKTYISQLDEVMGDISECSLNVLGAASSHGKSTIATTIAHHTSTLGGLCVDYINFEIVKKEAWFNLASLESSLLGLDVSSKDFKSANKAQKENYKTCIKSIIGKIRTKGGLLNIVDMTECQVDNFNAFCSKLTSIAEKRGRKADLIIIDNVDNFEIFKTTERDKTTAVNSMIIMLDSFCKTYYNNTGTAILLLTQLNRGGIVTLKSAEGEDSEEKGKKKNTAVDYRVFAQYNALYQKAQIAMVAYACERMRSLGRVNIYFVKLRNNEVPLEPLKLPANYAFSRVGGINSYNITNAESAFEKLYTEEDNIDELDDMEDLED